jgi:hypothetical protein
LILNHKLPLQIGQIYRVIHLDFDVLSLVLSLYGKGQLDLRFFLDQLENDRFLLIIGEYILNGHLIQILFMVRLLIVPDEVEVLVTKVERLHLGKLEIVKLELEYLGDRLVLLPVPLYILLDYAALVARERTRFVLVYRLLGYAQ